MKRAGAVGVLLLMAVVLSADEDKRVSMRCRGVSASEFCCIAEDTAKFDVHWRLYDPEQSDDSAEGKSACFKAPREWRVIEMKVVDDAAEPHLVRALVRRGDNTVVFASTEEP